MTSRLVLSFAFGAVALFCSTQSAWADAPQNECPDGQKAQCSIDGCACPKPPLGLGISGPHLPTNKSGPAICHTGNQKADAACLKAHRLDKATPSEAPN